MLEVKRAKKDGMGFNSIALTRNSLSDFCTCNYVPFFFVAFFFFVAGKYRIGTVCTQRWKTCAGLALCR